GGDGDGEFDSQSRSQGATMMVARRNGGALSLATAMPAPRGPMLHHKNLGKRSFLAGADRVRMG
ncbi:hypothetical protein, partial [Herbaspirillum sp.]|uniref:hypothetical protein n=1 Tax=Herbaspirillum sp. TaxID=1890675 RepID=UPI00258D9F19